MTIINCLIVDDEPIARDIIKTYCSHLPMLHVIADCGNVFDAKRILQEERIDILFLDIQMPILDGISFLKILKVLPQIIFTTAYKEYAVTAFDLAACDYLVKPFSLERFIIAVDKVLEKMNVSAKLTAEQNEANTFFIKAEGKIYNLYYNDILYAEAKGNYTRIITTNTTILPAISFTTFEESLPSNLFIRVHRSFIINKSKITHIEGNTAYINKVEIPIGSNYKEKFLSAIGL
jgi:two-component system, LytTR family, response regulator